MKSDANFILKSFTNSIILKLSELLHVLLLLIVFSYLHFKIYIEHFKDFYKL